MGRGNPNIRNHASKGGKASGKNRLTLDRVQAELGALETLEDAQRWLTQIALWACAGMLPSGSIAGAVVRSVEVWCRAHETKLTESVVGELRGEVARLKAELKGHRLSA